MVEILEVVFSSFWTFLGTVILIYLPCQTAVSVAASIQATYSDEEEGPLLENPETDDG